MQTPVGRCGIVVLFCRDPPDIVGVQYLLHLIVVRNIAEPPVELDEKNQIDPIRTNIIEHPHKGCTVFILLPGGDTLVNIDTSQLQPVISDISFQRFALGGQRQAVHGLLFCADADIKRGTLNPVVFNSVFIPSH